MHLVISGYYGYGNTGDEAILAALTDELRRCYPDVQLTVLSAAPEATARQYGVEAIPRWSLPAIWRALRGADLLISGGGGLIQDATSRLSPLYYLAILRLARLAGTPYMIFAQGLGPLRCRLTRWATARCFHHSAAITVRDEPSAQLLSQLGVTTPPVEITTDPALLLTPCPSHRTDELLRELGLSESTELIGIALRSWADFDVVRPAAALIRHLHQSQAGRVLLIPFQPEEDLNLAWRVASEAAAPVTILDQALEPRELLGVVSRLDLLVSMRLHGLIFAASAQVPAIALSYDPKVEAFASRAGQPTIELAELTPDELIRQADSLQQAGGKQEEKLEEKAGQLHSAAGRNFAVLDALLQSLPAR